MTEFNEDNVPEMKPPYLSIQLKSGTIHYCYNQEIIVKGTLLTFTNEIGKYREIDISEVRSIETSNE
jgi:hypothetical protein